MPIKKLSLLMLVLLLFACKNETTKPLEEPQTDIYSEIFEDNYFHQLAYLNEYGEELKQLVGENIDKQETQLVFWLKEGDCDSCIEQQMQFIKLVLKKENKPVIVFADYTSKRVFGSVKSSFDFVQMKMVAMPEALAGQVGSPVYIAYKGNRGALSIYKPIPERAAWTQRYLKSIDAL